MVAKNPIEFWLKDRNNVYIQLPVNPELIEYASPYGLNTISIASLGDVAIPGERGLKQVSFSSFFPRDYNASYCEYQGFMEPWKWIDQIEHWRDTRHNIRLIIAGTPISIPVFVEEFTLQPERAGAPGDIYYTISFTEYRPIKVKQVEVSSAASLLMAATRPPSQSTNPKTHTVVYSDTLWSIAKKYYGDGAKQTAIYEANKTTIGKESSLLKTGMVLKLP